MVYSVQMVLLVLDTLLCPLVYVQLHVCLEMVLRMVCDFNTIYCQE